ncbi:MAG: glycosyltransferase family 10 domain-containing protein [Cognatishimia activa]
MSVEPAVAFIPYGAKLGLAPSLFSLDRAFWPLGQPQRLVGKKLKDLSVDDHVLMYVNDTVHFRPSFGTRAKVSLLVMEPRAIHGRHLDRLQKSSSRFYKIFSHNEEFLSKCHNAEMLAFGTTWVPDWQELKIKKTKNMSLIASKKASLEGHALRHEMVDWLKESQIDFEALGGAYKAFDRKSDGLAPFRFSVVIENVRERNYFTEKLLDAIFCETVPIYWGCPNISDFFDTSAMMVCDTKEELERAILKVNDQTYSERVNRLRELKSDAAKYVALERRAAESLLAV